MAEPVNEAPETVPEATEKDNSAAQEMELEPEILQTDGDGPEKDSSEPNLKREREDCVETEKEENGADKKQKVDVEAVNEKVSVSVGPKSFGSSVEMFDYFYKLLHSWTPNLNLNKYEQLMMVDLLKKGHLEPDKKIGSGIRGFQVRYHPQFKSRCFFIIRDDDSVDDFSFRKCVDHILPLPENMQVKHHVNKDFGRGGGRGRGRGRGGWRGGKSRN